MTAAGQVSHSAQDSIRAYIRAKDENRPHLMRRAFVENARLRIVGAAGAIAFPPAADGLEAITDILVRRFAQTYENVHTFCLGTPPRPDDATFSCAWLVGMSEKESRAVRLGCGRYDWTFRAEHPRLAERLTITIDLMQVLPAEALLPLTDWLSRLPYPWCERRLAIDAAPADLPALVHRYLVADAARADHP